MGALDLKSVFADLGLGSKGLLGIDIGSSSIKICELSGGESSYKLTKFAIRPLPEGSFFEDEIQKADEIIEVIEHLIEEVQPKSTFVCMGIWGPNVISKRMQVAMASVEEIGDQVTWEIEQYLPFDIDDATTSFYLVGENSVGGADVLISAAKTELLENFRTLIEDAGLKVKVIDCNQFAIANVFSYVHEKELKEIKTPLLLLEIGANSINLIVFREGSVVFTRELPIGGQIVTNEVQKAMGLSYEEAEELKVNGDQSGNLPEEIVNIVNSSFDLFLTEIKRALDFYISSNDESSFQYCYITGGSSRLPGLVERLSKELSLEVLFFNPFDRIDVKSGRFDENSLSVISSVGVSVLGLAMRRLGDDKS